jgi:transposase
VRAFCRERKLCEHSFYWWRRQFGSAAEQPIRFALVETATPTTETPQGRAAPVLVELHEYLLKIREEVLPKSPASQAVSYALKNWQSLTRYCQDGGLAIDNNHTERSLRGIAVGRRNWLFVGSDWGGKTMAILRSFVRSCEMDGGSVRLVSRRSVAIGDQSIQSLEELLPHRWAAAAQAQSAR